MLEGGWLSKKNTFRSYKLNQHELVLPNCHAARMAGRASPDSQIRDRQQTIGTKCKAAQEQRERSRMKEQAVIEPCLPLSSWIAFGRSVLGIAPQPAFAARTRAHGSELNPRRCTLLFDIEEESRPCPIDHGYPHPIVGRSLTSPRS